MAPDQSALKAASGLLKPAKWPLRGRSGELIWGECQGSGANPYRVAGDLRDHGSKCTCPSRKFPCKHALALMWMYVEDSAAFPSGDVPDWVSDWLRRRRKGAASIVAEGDGKSLDAARDLAPSVVDPEVEARRKAASQKRAEDTQRSVYEATEELDVWIADQLRTGLTGFLGALGERCRRIAARLVDAKAASLAGRIDEMPSRLLALPKEERIDAAIVELGKLVLLVRAWRAAPNEPDLRREVVSAESRDDVLANPEAPRVAALWEVLGERVATRRDGLVSQATWLMSFNPHRFALLLDFFPASAGRRSGVFAAGERFEAELAFYPAREPLRAVIARRGERVDATASWPEAPTDLFRRARRPPSAKTVADRNAAAPAEGPNLRRRQRPRMVALRRQYLGAARRTPAASRAGRRNRKRHGCLGRRAPRAHRGADELGQARLQWMRSKPPSP
jgi:hypothetical protein